MCVAERDIMRDRGWLYYETFGPERVEGCGRDRRDRRGRSCVSSI